MRDSASSPAATMTQSLTHSEAYTEFRPLFFSALARLARGGYPVPPDESLDLIHDFFIEAWPGLLERYDPDRARFTTYAFQAFVRFARPRIARLNRWRQLDFRTEAEGASDAQDVEVEYDIARIRDALRQLPMEDREILEARLSGGQSERILAKSRGISRYRMRERSVEAVARLVSVLRDSSIMDQQDWPIVQAIWGEGRSIQDVAERLGLTVAQVRFRKRRILDSLARTMPASLAVAEEKKTMANANAFCDLWKELVEAPRPQTVQQARACWEQLSQHLEECPTCSECVPTTSQSTAAIYELLAGEVEGDHAETDLLQLRDTIDRDVRDAVENILFSVLSRAFVERAERWDSLAIFRGIRAIGMLAHRQTHGAGERAKLSPAGMEVMGEKTEAPHVIREVRVLSKLDDDQAKSLFLWIVDAARSFPSLIPGVVAQPSGTDGVVLTIVDMPLELDLALQWAPAHAESVTATPAP
jgi:RNA polymerase sigma factor (sigma-70 family)